jgi:hypothetical protein
MSHGFPGICGVWGKPVENRPPACGKSAAPAFSTCREVENGRGPVFNSPPGEVAPAAIRSGSAEAPPVFHKLPPAVAADRPDPPGRPCQPGPLDQCAGAGGGGGSPGRSSPGPRASRAPSISAAVLVVVVAPPAGAPRAPVPAGPPRAVRPRCCSRSSPWWWAPGPRGQPGPLDQCGGAAAGGAAPAMTKRRQGGKM